LTIYFLSAYNDLIVSVNVATRLSESLTVSGVRSTTRI